MAQQGTFLIVSYRNPYKAAQTIGELRCKPIPDSQVGLLVRDDHERCRFKSIEPVI